jgi:DNA-binding CsgD family transcriptional regulator
LEHHPKRLLSMSRPTRCPTCGRANCIITVRQREIIRWLAEGKTSWEVATILNISKRTVEWHAREARRRLGASNIPHLIAETVKRGAISIGLGTGIIAATTASVLEEAGSSRMVFQALFGLIA